MKDPAVGVWAGAGTALLSQVHGMPLLRLTCKRIWWGCTVLIPWNSELDHMESACEEWKLRVVRCHTEERIAMRDLVADRMPDVGMLIPGNAADVDEAEVRLAFARLNAGFEKYESARVRAYPAATWLGFTDNEDWKQPPRAVDELSMLLPPTGITLDTRYLRRREGR